MKHINQSAPALELAEKGVLQSAFLASRVKWKKGVVSEVAADEVAPELVRGVHDGEAASRRVYDKITRPSDGTDELSDETNRLDVGVKCAVDLFRPSVRNAVIAPGAFRGEWRLLQHQQIISAPPRPVAVADAFAVPSDEVNTL